MIQITGISASQRELLDRIWECDNSDDINELKMAIPEESHTIDLLIEAIVLATIDEFVQTKADCFEANDLLSTF